MRRLNLGCGPVQPDGWDNVDSNPIWGATVADPLGDFPFEEWDFDYVVANHVLQMVAWIDLVDWLAAVRFVLKAGGVFRVLVPDLDAAIDARYRKNPAHFEIDDRHEASLDGKFCMYVTQAGSTRSVFTEAWLRELLARAGFARVVRPLHGGTLLCEDPGICDLDSRRSESILLEARR